MSGAQGGWRETGKLREWRSHKGSSLGYSVCSRVRSSEPQSGLGGERGVEVSLQMGSDGGPSANTTVGHHSGPRGGVPAWLL